MCLVVSVLLTGCGLVSHRRTPSLASLCAGWSPEQIERHRAAFTTLPEAAVADLSTGGYPVDTSDAVGVETFTFDEMRNRLGACVEFGGSMSAKGFATISEVVAFPSWSNLKTFIKYDSRAADGEADRHTTHVPSPAASRQINIGGSAYRTLYCLNDRAAGCARWNMVTIAGPCRSIAIDITLVRGFNSFDKKDATVILSRIADLWAAKIESELKDVPCTDYAGVPEPFVWKP
jgi:hypothetical protein